MQAKINHSVKLIADALEEYKNIAVFCSFGKDSVTLLHLCLRVNPQIQVVSIMTPYKFQETHDYKEHIANLWNLNLVTYSAPLVVNKSGEKNLYETDPEKCCDYYKVEPTRRAVKELKLDAWISGLRGTEGHSRNFLDEIEVRGGLVKINSILRWTEAEIWLYHAINNIPVHPLYAQGYRSLGCAPCSSPYEATERGGRWKGLDKCECGIHTKNLVEQSAMPKTDVYGKPKRSNGKF